MFVMFEKEASLNAYLAQFRKEPHSRLEQMNKEARERGIPIMQPETMSSVEQLIRLHEPRTILEIGTAIGYSAMNMVLASSNRPHVVTIERDSNMVKEARENIKALDLTDTITVLERDALEAPESLSDFGTFDLLFIDAGKGHYTTFFETYTPFLSSRGVILCDNVLFRGYVLDPDSAPKRLQKMAGKMRQFNQWLHDHPDYQTVLLPIGDGLSISMKLK